MDTALSDVREDQPDWLNPLGYDRVAANPDRPSDEFFALVERLATDSAWTWLGHLATLLRRIDETLQRESPSGKPDLSYLQDGEYSDPASPFSIERICTAAEHYRAVLSINAALTQKLSHIGSSLAHITGAVAAPGINRRQGLSRWQERRAKSYLMQNLASRVSNARMAAACGLSSSYFVTAFRLRTGETPHAYLLRHRVTKAKQLLQGPMTLADVALACGFSDQSHLTRVFKKHTGIAPGEWRRERCDRPA